MAGHERIVVASCYYSEDQTAFLTLDPFRHGMYYAIEFWNLDGYGELTDMHDSTSYENIVQAAPYWSELCGVDL